MTLFAEFANDLLLFKVALALTPSRPAREPVLLVFVLTTIPVEGASVLIFEVGFVSGAELFGALDEILTDEVGPSEWLVSTLTAETLFLTLTCG
jgi:hypothetical protein